MGILDGIEPTPRRAYSCRIADILAKLEPADQKILQAALDDREKWSHDGLAMRLRERGLQTTGETLRKHRFLLCSCSRI